MKKYLVAWETTVLANNVDNALAQAVRILRNDAIVIDASVELDFGNGDDNPYTYQKSSTVRLREE